MGVLPRPSPLARGSTPLFSRSGFYIGPQRLNDDTSNIDTERTSGLTGAALTGAGPDPGAWDKPSSGPTQRDIKILQNWKNCANYWVTGAKGSRVIQAPLLSGPG